jgi:hypothetical protein
VSLGQGVESFVNVKDAIRYRVNDLTSTSSFISWPGLYRLHVDDARRHLFHQKLNPEKQFQNFAYGIVRYPMFSSYLATL